MVMNTFSPLLPSRNFILPLTFRFTIHRPSIKKNQLKIQELFDKGPKYTTNFILAKQ